jgi:hypothetical protein
LVEPPVAMMSDTAFSIDLRVTMSRGFKSFFTAFTRTLAEAAAESAFSASGEAICEDPSRLMPSASNEDDIVLAVYIPPHAPTLGHAFFSIPTKSSSLILPAAKVPTASNALTIVRSWPFHRPGLIVPA